VLRRILSSDPHILDPIDIVFELYPTYVPSVPSFQLAAAIAEAYVGLRVFVPFGKNN